MISCIVMTCGCFPEIIPCFMHCITDWVSIKFSASRCVLCKLINNHVLQSYSLQPGNNLFSSNSIGYRCTNIHNLHWLLQPAVSKTLWVWKMWDKLHKLQVCAMQTWYLFHHPYLKLTSWKGEPVFSLALYFDELLKQLTYIPCNNTRCKNIPGGMIVYKLPWTANCAVGVHSGVQMCYEHPLNKSAAC